MQYRARGAAFLKKYVEPLFYFLDYIQEDIEIGIRPHTVDRGWEVPLRIQNRYQKRSLKILSGKFKSAIYSAKICVHGDPFSTTFLETLAANIPTIAFFDPDLNKIKGESQEYIDDLMRAEILHPSPRQAAEKLNSAFDELEAWWKKPIVQEARSRFVRQFARTSKDWKVDWKKEFDEVLERGV
jgi:putative transferase (TIGR04331 family)